jgi:hypothetical protein
MSDFDVDIGGMSTGLLSDSDAEALIAGDRVDGVPPQLGDMLSTIREQATEGPGVPISGALTEFIIARTASVTPIGAASAKANRPGPRRFAKKAAAASTIVPAKLLIGATMAAAAVGGAQAFGVVDVPLLPGPEPVVVTTTVPVETLPATASATTTVVPSTTIVALSQSSAGTTVSRATVPGQPPSNATPVASPPAVSTPATEDLASGCDFGQETSGRPAGESNGDPPDRRPDVPANTVVLPIDPCTRGEDDRPRPPEPADTSRGNGAPSSVPGANGGDSVGGSPGPTPEDHPGHASGHSGGAAPDHVPTSAQGGNGNGGGGSAPTSLPRNPGQGRTPRGD